MDLMINTFGAYLHRSGELFIIKTKEAQQEVSARKIRSIMISTGASLSTDAIELALEKNIDIVFLDKFGAPLGRIWHGRPGSTTAIRRAQLRLADTDQGLQLALSWLLRKLDNQIEFLQQTARRRPRLAEDLHAGIALLQQQRQPLTEVQGNLEQRRNDVMLLEARAGFQYWQLVRLLLPETYKFEARSRNPAQDEFNCLLNYAYGVLYSIVERACVLAGLDPYVGFIHSDHYNKISLVFDLIECYRIWADETVIGLFAACKVKQDMFDKLENGYLLNKQGKIVLMENFEPFLETSMLYKRRHIKRRDMVQLDCHQIANGLIG